MYLAQANFAIWKEDVSAESVKTFLDFANQIMSSSMANSAWVWSRPGSFFNDISVVEVFANSKIILNVSVWKDFLSLKQFVYNDVHLKAMKNRHLWFDIVPDQASVLWWVAPQHQPTLEEAQEKFQLLNHIGPSIEAFTFSNFYES